MRLFEEMQARRHTTPRITLAVFATFIAVSYLDYKAFLRRVPESRYWFICYYCKCIISVPRVTRILDCVRLTLT